MLGLSLVIINRDIKEYCFPSLMAFFLICSNSIIFPGIYTLLIAFGYVAFYKIRYGTFTIKYSKLNILFLLACYISVFSNLYIDYRILMFTGMMLICAPFYVSKKVFLFERKILSVILLFFPVVSMIAMYCYLKGINAFAQEGVHIDLSFSAIYYHPMWLAPIAGLANVILLWCLFQLQNKCFRCIVLSILLLSIYVTVVAASRTALFASVITMVLYIVYNARNVKKIILYLLVIGFLATISIPVYLEHSTQIQNKFEGGKGEKYGSRSAHFGEGFEKLNESPLIGSGFATAWYRGVLHKGRLESGSGWLSILFQLGALGAIIMLFILKKVTRVFKYIRHDRRLQLFVISLLFLCLHSCFEGYLLTVGYYIGFVFWLLMSHIICYPDMVKKYKLNFES